MVNIRVRFTIRKIIDWGGIADNVHVECGIDVEWPRSVHGISITNRSTVERDRLVEYFVQYLFDQKNRQQNQNGLALMRMVQHSRATPPNEEIPNAVHNVFDVDACAGDALHRFSDIRKTIQ